MTDLKPEAFRIYNYMEGRFDDEENVPFDVDFKTQLNRTLYKVPAPLVKGEPVETIYYEDATMQVPVCKLEYTFLRYHRDNFGEAPLHGFIKQTIIKLKWYRNDGTLSEEFKDLGIVYNPSLHLKQMIEEGVLKRNLIYQNLKTNVLGMLQMALSTTHTPEEAKAVGVQFIEDNKAGFDNYVDAYNLHIITAIQNNTTDEWLNTVIDPNTGATIRHYMIGELDLG